MSALNCCCSISFCKVDADLLERVGLEGFKAENVEQADEGAVGVGSGSGAAARGGEADKDVDARDEGAKHTAVDGLGQRRRRVGRLHLVESLDVRLTARQDGAARGERLDQLGGGRRAARRAARAATSSSSTKAQRMPESSSDASNCSSVSASVAASDVLRPSTSAAEKPMRSSARHHRAPRLGAHRRRRPRLAPLGQAGVLGLGAHLAQPPFRLGEAARESVEHVVVGLARGHLHDARALEQGTCRSLHPPARRCASSRA